MFRPVKEKRFSASFLYLIFALVLVVWATPRLRVDTTGWHGVFQFGWLTLAMVIIAANLWFLLDASPQRNRRSIAVPMRVRRVAKRSRVRMKANGEKETR